MSAPANSRREPRAAEPLKLRLGVPLAILFLKLLSRTWRVRRLNSELVDSLRSARQPVVFAFWHGQMLPLMHAHRNENITVLISEHKDGEIIARVASSFGFPAVRGSSTRGAVRGLVGLVNAVRGGGDVGVTPDGPRGPARVFAPGVIAAARRAGAPLVPIAAGASSAWKLRTWDGFVIPRPFARITVAYGDPQAVAGESGSIEAAAQRFRDLLNEASRRAGGG